MIEELKKVFGTYTRSLETLYLMNGLKRAVRLDASESELKEIKMFCEENSLCIEVSDFKVIKIKDKGKGNYANIAKKAPQNYFGDGLYHAYISKDKTMSRFLKLLENKNDDAAIGQLLGYPKCCIDFFLENKEKQQNLQNDCILPALNNSEGFKFPFYTNYAARYFDFTLLSHFPHDFNCGESMEIAKKNLACIKNHSQELAAKIEAMLKCAVLYTETHGVFIFRECKLEADALKNTLKFGTVYSTTKNELFELLNKNKAVEVINKNKIRIGDKIMEDIGFMVFN